MGTIVKVSVSGRDKASLRDAIASILTMAGFRRRGTVEFFSHDGLSPNAASVLIAKLYDTEGKIAETSLMTLSVQSLLIDVEMKKDKNRSV